MIHLHNTVTRYKYKFDILFLQPRVGLGDAISIYK